jgi:hypothetical protein
VPATYRWLQVRSGFANRGFLLLTGELMEPNDTSKETSFDMMKLAAGLNEMRDTLVLLSTLIKDYKATMDWDNQGEGMLKALEVVMQAARSSEGSGSRSGTAE